MPTGPSHPTGVQRDHALSLMFAERGGAVVLVADGDTSMVPHLRGGDAVLAVPPSAEPTRGELVLFKQQDYWVVHRCLGRAERRDGRRGFRTRGDGRNVLDPHLLAEDVRARVVAVRRGGAWRSLEGGLARGYAQMLAWHDMTWAAAGIAARKVGLGAAVAALDLAVLRVAVPLAFPLFHRRIAAPALASADGTV